MRPVARYHPVLVALHWLIALLIVAALCIGFFGLAPIPNGDPRKIAILRVHMAGGMLILALMAIRFAVRVATARPAAAATGYRLLDRTAPVAHHGFYLLVLLMAATGLSTAVLAGLNRIVFQGSGEPLPPNFATFPTFVAHFCLAGLLVALIALHALAALYHQFVVGDGLLARMSFGRRAARLR